MADPLADLMQALRAARSVILQAEQRRLDADRRAIYEDLWGVSQELALDQASRGRVRVRATAAENEAATQPASPAIERPRRRA